MAYFGLIVGDMVRPFHGDSSEDDDDDDDEDSGIDSPPPPPKKFRLDDSSSFFHLCNLLCEIITIVCSETVCREQVDHLRMLIREFLILCMKLYDSVSGPPPQGGDGGEDDDVDRDGRIPPEFHFLTLPENDVETIVPL